MKKNNKKGFFLSETMVVIAVVAVVLLGVFKLFNSVYFSFIQGENYNTVNAINALSNVQKYYESKGNIDTTIITEEISYVDLTNYESYNSDYYTRLKEEFKIDGIYLMDLNKLYTSDINNFYINFRKYLNTLKNIQGIVLVISIDGKEFAYTEIENYQSVTLIGDEEDEFAVYVPIGGTFIDPGYKNWEGEEPTITWENDEEVDTNKAGTYYKYYDFNGYLLRRKIQVGNHTLAKYVDNLESLEESEEEVYTNGLVQTTAEYEGTTYDAGIRYYGANPNNYVYFNCKENDTSGVSYGSSGYDYASSCEKWRIIGVFDTKTSENEIYASKRVKIIGDSFSIGMSWDSSSSLVNLGYGINQWGESTYEDGTVYKGADLMQILNGYYIGEDTKCNYCNGAEQETCENDCSGVINPLSNNSINKIEKVIWNLGATKYNETISLFTIYNNERGIQSGKICVQNEKYCSDNIIRTNVWNGKVGLMYPSDYAYASADKDCPVDIYGSDSTCEIDNWLTNGLNNWTIGSRGRATMAYGIYIYASSSINSGAAYTVRRARPSVYLKSSIEIVSGSGTSSSPYIIK